MEISNNDFIKLFFLVKVIDIRTTAEYLQGHIPGSYNIFEELLLKNPRIYLNPADVYYIICNTGIASTRASQALTNAGYRVVNVKEGIKNWQGPLIRGPY